ncbi:Gx transporter family protein [Ruminococcaceae bacterium OttesenSCG-928-O06]|nr:Gx transporter family protein [Ruminococcaceae bacterium OttesenSCG-928-O06]
MQNRPARRVALTGMLFALALLFSYLESFLTPLLGLPPGVKIGLANTVVLYALLFLPRRYALLLVLLKAGFAFITRGAVAAALSAAGGLLSLVVMVLLLLPKKKVGLLVLSVAGALFHNMGQLVVVRVLFGHFSLYYAPVLVVSGVVMGCLTGLLLRALLPALQRAGLGVPGAESPAPPRGGA